MPVAWCSMAFSIYAASYGGTGECHRWRSALGSRDGRARSIALASSPRIAAAGATRPLKQVRTGRLLNVGSVIRRRHSFRGQLRATYLLVSDGNLPALARYPASTVHYDTKRRQARLNCMDQRPGAVTPILSIRPLRAWASRLANPFLMDRLRQSRKVVWDHQLKPRMLMTANITMSVGGAEGCFEVRSAGASAAHSGGPQRSLRTDGSCSLICSIVAAWFRVVATAIG
jgi:hypothetical protein